ncbi:MAG: DUF3575 domain-containing protein [Bacteroidota bacterium]
MKFFRHLLLLSLMCIAGSTYAQQSVVKLNLLGLINRHISGQLELPLNDQISIGLGVGVTPSRGIPGIGLVRSLIVEDPDASNFIFDGSFSKFTITPELRFYFVPYDDVPTGVYISGALRYGRNTVTLPFEFTAEGSTDPITVEARGRITNIGPMLSLGGQFLLNDALTLDIYTGVGIAISPLSLSVSDNVVETDQYTALRDQLLEELNANVDPERVDDFIQNNGVNISFPIVLPLLRIGVALGYTF